MVKLIGLIYTLKEAIISEFAFGTAVSLEESKQDLKRAIQLFVVAFVVLSIMIAIVLFYTDTTWFFLFVQEDGFIEFTTAIFLLITSFICITRAYNSSYRSHTISSILCAFAFFFGFGEEISWGQRIFQIETPEELMKINVQKELTIHNIELYGISFKKVIFRLVLNSFVLCYFIGFPFAFSKKEWFRGLIKKYNIPVPTLFQSTFFIISFLIALLVNEGKKWELVEFAIAAFAFLVFLLPGNVQSKSD